jgi:hypothetical protein
MRQKKRAVDVQTSGIAYLDGCGDALYGATLKLETFLMRETAQQEWGRFGWLMAETGNLRLEA